MIGLVIMTSEVSPFGRWVKDRRTALGLSLRELAERTKGACSHGLIGQIETGRGGKRGTYRPHREIVDSLAKALDANVDEARIAAGYAPSAEFLFRFDQGLIGWDDLTEYQKTAVMEVAQAAVKAILEIDPATIREAATKAPGIKSAGKPDEHQGKTKTGVLKLDTPKEKRKTGSE